MPAPKNLDYTIDITKPKCVGDIQYGAMTFLRNNNPNGLSPQLKRDKGGAYLRLAVEKDAYTKATDGEPDMRDRCELRDSKVKLGTAVWYSFEMRVERGFPEVDARFVCAQMKAPYYDANGGSPLFALRLDHGRYFATIEHLYETKDVRFVHGTERSRYLTPYDGSGSCPSASVRALDHHVFPNGPSDFKELQVRAVFATDSRGLPGYLKRQFLSCTSGVQVRTSGVLPDDIHRWWRFKVALAPTNVKDSDGIVQLFASDPADPAERLVATATGEFGHVGYADPATNTGPIPGEAQQYFKVGPYRDKLHIWGKKAAAIHVRNIRRGAWAYGRGYQRQALAKMQEAARS